MSALGPILFPGAQAAFPASWPDLPQKVSVITAVASSFLPPDPGGSGLGNSLWFHRNHSTAHKTLGALPSPGTSGRVKALWSKLTGERRMTCGWKTAYPSSPSGMSKEAVVLCNLMTTSCKGNIFCNLAATYVSCQDVRSSVINYLFNVLSFLPCSYSFYPTPLVSSVFHDLPSS